MLIRDLIVDAIFVDSAAEQAKKGLLGDECARSLLAIAQYWIAEAARMKTHREFVLDELETRAMQNKGSN